MRIVIMAASMYGMKCIEAIKGLEIANIVGIITTKRFYTLKHGNENKKEMDNPIYDVLYEKCTTWKIPLFEIDKMNDDNTICILKEWSPEVVIVSGWYHLLGDKILSIPTKGVIGLHSSLLPKYRGGAPLVWQLINGEKKTGITLFYMNAGVDTGDIIAQKEVEIEENDTIKTLYEKVGKRGIELLIENLPLIEQNCESRIKQENLNDSDIYPQRIPDDGLIDWNQDTVRIYDFIRAQTKPYPGAYTLIKGKVVKIWSSELVGIKERVDSPGTIISIKKIEDKEMPIIATGSRSTALKILDYSYEEKGMNNSTLWIKGDCL